MARIRTIKPQFFIDQDIAALHPLSRILFQGLWCLADRRGRLEDKPQQIKVQILPYDNHDIESALKELSGGKFIVRYETEGKKYIEIRSFEKHQHCHIKEPESTIPAPGKHRAKTVPKRQEGKGREQEGKGTGREGKEGGKAAFVFPDWMPKDVWEDFEEMRKKIKKPMTDRARQNIISKLDLFKAKGHDPTAILDKSITNDWQDVYEPKPEGGNGAGQRYKSVSERKAEHNEQARLNARVLLGIPGGGGKVSDGLSRNNPVNGKTPDVHEGAVSVPEVETFKTG